MQKYLGGVVGVIIALVFETVLFIARASMQTNAGMKYTHLLDPKKAKLQAQPATPAGKPFTTQPSGKGKTKLPREGKKDL
jgi:hypothetical protein